MGDDTTFIAIVNQNTSIQITTTKTVMVFNDGEVTTIDIKDDSDGG